MSKVFTVTVGEGTGLVAFASFSDHTNAIDQAKVWLTEQEYEGKPLYVSYEDRDLEDVGYLNPLNGATHAFITERQDVDWREEWSKNKEAVVR